MLNENRLSNITYLTAALKTERMGHIQQKKRKKKDQETKSGSSLLFLLSSRSETMKLPYYEKRWNFNL